MTQNVILLLFTKRVILIIEVLVVQYCTLPHVILVNLNQRLVMKLILLEHLNSLIRTRVLKVGCLVLFKIELCLVLGLKPITQPGLVNILGLGQLLSQLLDLFSQCIVILGLVFVDLDFHFQYLCTFGEHQCG